MVAATTSTASSGGCGVFPGARFLVSTRNHADVLKSKWWAKGEDKSSAWPPSSAASSTVTPPSGHFDDYVADPSVLRRCSSGSAAVRRSPCGLSLASV